MVQHGSCAIDGSPVLHRPDIQAPLCEPATILARLVYNIGWLATAAFAASYFCAPVALRPMQAPAAVLWIGYGSLMHALPVIVASAVVARAAF